MTRVLLNQRKEQALTMAVESAIREGDIEPFTGRKLRMIKVTQYKPKGIGNTYREVRDIFKMSARTHKGW